MSLVVMIILEHISNSLAQNLSSFLQVTFLNSSHITCHVFVPHLLGPHHTENQELCEFIILMSCSSLPGCQDE